MLLHASLIYLLAACHMPVHHTKQETLSISKKPKKRWVAKAIAKKKVPKPKKVKAKVPPKPRVKTVSKKSNLSTTLTDGLPLKSSVFAKLKKGFLPAKIVRRILKKALPRLRKCTRRARMLLPKSSHTIRMTIVIGPKGRVWRSLYKSALATAPRTLRCVKRAVHRLMFPPPQRGGFFATLHSIQL